MPHRRSDKRTCILWLESRIVLHTRGISLSPTLLAVYLRSSASPTFVARATTALALSLFTVRGGRGRSWRMRSLGNCYTCWYMYIHTQKQDTISFSSSFLLSFLHLQGINNTQQMHKHLKLCLCSNNKAATNSHKIAPAKLSRD